jgi:hypothetical protein
VLPPPATRRLCAGFRASALFLNALALDGEGSFAETGALLVVIVRVDMLANGCRVVNAARGRGAAVHVWRVTVEEDTLGAASCGT